MGAQFHDQPNPDLDEEWDSFPSHSPSISMTYANIEGEHMLGVMYGLYDLNRLIGSFKVQENKWYKITMRISWSTKNDGAINVYLDDSITPVFSAKGRNMYNNYQHYFKVGMYRHPEINTNASLYIRNVSILSK